MTAAFDWTVLPWHPGVEVVAAGPEWVAVAKPAGVLSHPNRGADRGRSVLDAPFDPEAGVFRTGSLSVGLCHRLDGPTSGVLLLAKPGPVFEDILAAFGAGHVRKRYRAIVIGRPARPEGAWRDRLARSRDGGKGIRVARAASGEEAVTGYQVLQTFRGAPPLAELRLEPVTGRTHQLRVQAALRKLPILGDATYGDFALNRKLRARRLYLHAESVALRLSTGERIRSEVPPPSDFARASGSGGPPTSPSARGSGRAPRCRRIG